MSNKVALLEAVLFLESEPVSIQEIAKIAHISQNDARAALLALQNKYVDGEHGIELVQLDNSWQIIPKKSLWAELAPRYASMKNQALSRAAQETLSIIAYSQPITRLEIDGIRGVSSVSMINLLKERDLVKEVGKKNVLGNPIQYGTTEFFLKQFQLSSISDLPKLDEIEEAQFQSQ